ncbi:hypothetical protein SWPG_00132 [Synechococcus phage S-CBM2]|nr:hypothetical protein SWPG_00132 [Synechococcus phage S-CBM2]
MFNWKYDDLGLPQLKAVERNGMRFYQRGDKYYPSVTTVTGIRSKRKILEWRQKVGEEYATRESGRATARGSLYHEITEDYLRNNYDEKKWADKVLPHMLFRISKNILDRINNIHTMEAPLYSDFLGLAGRVDCIGEYDGKLSVIDFKTSTKPKKRDWIENYFVQCTAYATMYYELTGREVEQLVVIIANEKMETQVFIEKDIDTQLKLLKEYMQEFVQEMQLHA